MASIQLMGYNVITEPSITLETIIGSLRKPYCGSIIRLSIVTVISDIASVVDLWQAN